MNSSYKPHLTAVATALSMVFAGDAAAQVPPTCAVVIGGPSICTVTSTADAGVGTLRDALTTVTNDFCGCAGSPYSVRFAFAGVATIAPATPLTVGNCPVSIDGYDQSAATANGATPNTLADVRTGTNASPRVVINGAVVSGPVLSFGTGTAGSVLKGLVFQNYGTTAVQVQSANVSILGNHFGTDPGATACAGAGNGVGLELTFGATGHQVGGLNAADRNVFGCSTDTGIDVFATTGSIRGNLIGTGAANAALPNGVGVFLEAGFGSNNAIGQPAIGAGNLIARNSGAGVVVAGNRNAVSIQGNDIFLNGGIGIDLGFDGPTANNASTFPNSSLANGGMNTPRIDFVRYNTANTTIDWSFNGFANTTVFVGFHSNPAGLGIDEGARWFGVDSAFTSGTGAATGSATFAGIQPSPTATATTTSSGTSEFSPAAALDVNPKFLTFTGSVGSTSAPQVVTYTNLGSASILVGPPTTTGDFAATSTCDGTTPVAPNGTCTASVTFSPLALGAATNALDMPTTGTGGGRGIELSGNAVATPVLSPSLPGPIDFGSQRVGTASPSTVVTFANSGNGDLLVSGVALSGAAASSFAVLADTCTGFTLNATTPSCTVTLGMQPAVAGPLAASLVVSSNATNPTVSIGLTGVGIAPVLASNPAGSINFGTIQIGSASAPVSVNFTNSGNGSLTVGSATLTGAAASSFQVVSDGCAGQTLTATPATSCAIALAMQPQAAGALAATLQVSSDATNPNLAVSLAGTGSTAPVVAPNLGATPPGPVDFGSRRIGTQSPPAVFTLSPSGPGPVAISSVAPRGTGFSVVSDTCTGATIAQGATVGSCSFSVIFAPGFEGQYRTAIQVLSNSNNPQLLIEVTGTGTPLPVGRLAASPGSVPFGTQAVGVTTNPQTVQVTNVGTLPVTVGNVRATGDFAQTNDCRLLDSAQSCRALVTFTPTTPGERMGNLIVESDAANPQLVVSLQGTASAAPVPVVELNPGAVAFGTALMGSGGGGTLVTLRNSGGASLELGRIYTVGDFRVTHNCPTSVPPGASCQVTVAFSPSITGSRTGKLVVESNASGGNKEASLSGTGCRNFGMGTSRLAQPICR